MSIKRLMIIIAVLLLGLGLVSTTLAAASSAQAPEALPASVPERVTVAETARLGFIDGPAAPQQPSSPTGVGAWDTDGLDAPTVISDTASGQFKMWYNGRDRLGNNRLGLATSDEGITWTKSGSNPLLEAYNPEVRKEGVNDYKMWFGLNSDIFTATSTDGVSWVVGTAPVFTPTGQDTFDRDFVANPSIVVDGSSIYWMYYVGWNEAWELAQIGVATSTNGIDWTRVQTTPVLTPGNPGDWDENHTLDPIVLLEDGAFKIWYRSLDSSFTGRIGHATSPDGVTWTKDGSNPVLEPDSGQWDEGSLRNPYVYTDTYYSMWYVSNGQIGYVTSTDGINWSRFLSDPVLGPGPRLFINVNYGHDWIEANTLPQASVAITVDKGVDGLFTNQGQADEWGNYYTDGGSWTPYQPDIAPGDIATATALGLLASVDPVGTINLDKLDMEADTISGTIHADWFMQPLTVTCEIWDDMGPPPVVITDVVPNGGGFFCDFSGAWDIQPGNSIAVRYHEPDGDTVINVFDGPWMRVNYAHDWVGGSYPAGHTFWITVTESGGSNRATAQVQSAANGGWGGDGFETQGGDWQPPDPDIQHGDTVYFQSDDGYTNTIKVGEISGTLDVVNDSISGPIYADWFTGPLYVECHPWGAPGPAPGKDSTAEPDGTVPYSCQWNPLTEWDIQPGQDVAVMYFEPDNDRVINVFRDPAPNLNAEKWVEGSGEVMPGGPVVFGLRVRNNGEATATSLWLTDTLPISTTYLTDTSGVPATFSPGAVSWALGPLDPDEELQFQLVLTNTANPSDTLENQVDVYTQYDEDPGNNHSSAEAHVSDEDPDLWVDKHPEPGDPAPGQTFLYRINYGNNGPASGHVVLTDTLPISTSVVTWSSANGYNLWQEVSRNGELVLEAPSVPGHWGDTIDLRLLLDAGVAPGTQLTNTVEITTAGDSAPEDNWHQNNDAHANDPRWNASVDKGFHWGRLVPGGEVQFGLHPRNNGNMAVQVWLTDTLPAGTSYAASYRSMGGTEVPYPYDYYDGQIVAWDLGTLEPGASLDINLRLSISDTAPTGTSYTNCAEVYIPTEDDWPYDDQACVEYMVQPYGPNLRLEKRYDWNYVGQLRYEIRFYNVGSEELENITLTDTLPISTSWNGNWWTDFWEFIPDPTYNNNQLVWELDRIEPGWSSGIYFEADLDGSIINEQGLAFTNTVIGPVTGDVYPADNEAQVVAYTGPDAFIEKQLSGGELMPGKIVTFTVHYGNQNRWPWDSDGSAGYWLTDTLPSVMSFITATAPWNPNEDWTPNILPGNVLEWQFGPMYNQNDWYYDIVVQISDTVQDGDLITNVIEIYGDSPTDVDPIPSNNVYELPLSFVLPEYAVSKVYDTSMVAGTTVTYTLTAENTGSVTGTMVMMEDELPANLTYTDSDGAWDGSQVSWDLGDLGASETGEGWFSAQLACTAGVAVNNDQYRVASSQEGFTSPDGPAVSFNILAPSLTASVDQSASTVLEGETVYFTATASTDGTPLTYAWDFDDGGVAISATASHAYVSAGTYDVEMTVTDQCGFTETVTTQVTVNPISVCTPVSSVSLTYNPASPVINTMVTFTATVTPATATSPITYLWTFGDGSTLTNGPVVQHTYTSAGAYNAQVTAINSCTPGSGVSDSQAVAVQPHKVYLSLIMR